MALREIASIVMLLRYSRGDWVFNSMGSECDWTPEDTKSTKENLMGWLKREGYQKLGKYKYGELFIKYKD
jgi:hypothetical protein